MMQRQFGMDLSNQSGFQGNTGMRFEKDTFHAQKKSISKKMDALNTSGAIRQNSITRLNT